MSVSTIARPVSSVTNMSFVPSDFDSLYRHYYRYVTGLVKRRGITEQNADDVAQSILAKFWEKGMLQAYDPKTVARSGRYIVFGSFLGAFVISWLPSHWHAQRDLQRSEFDFIDSRDAAESISWLEGNGVAATDDTSSIDEEILADSIRARLQKSQPVNSQDSCDLPALFDAIRARVLRDEDISTTDLGAEFGVARITVRKWLIRLRSEVDRILEEV